jgi:hypothetical protein
MPSGDGNETNEKSARGEASDSGRLIIEHFEEILKTQNLECMFDLRREAANLDVAASLANLLDKAHKNAETGRRDVIQLFAVDDDEVTPGINLGLNRVFKLWRRVSINKAFDGYDRKTVFNGCLYGKWICHVEILLESAVILAIIIWPRNGMPEVQTGNTG